MSRASAESACLPRYLAGENAGRENDERLPSRAGWWGLQYVDWDRFEAEQGVEAAEQGVEAAGQGVAA